MKQDNRNVVDRYKGKSTDAIKADLDTRRISLEIAIENLERDFNMGTIVRTANAFNVAKVHIIGRRQWNKRGAMMTDKYMNIEYHQSPGDFIRAMRKSGKSVIAIDIVDGARGISEAELPERSVLVYGSESDGLSNELLNDADQVLCIEQSGSTRSINVGVAAGITMYMWLLQHQLNR